MCDFQFARPVASRANQNLRQNNFHRTTFTGQSECIAKQSCPQRSEGREAARLCAVNFFANSEAFQNIRNQRFGEIATQTLEGRRILLQKRRQVRGRLVLLPENVILVLIKNFSVAAIQGN